MNEVYRLSPFDKSWVAKIFYENFSNLNSDFDIAWREGIFWGIKDKAFIRLRYGPITHICELVTSEKYRRCGFGSMLLNMVPNPVMVAVYRELEGANHLYKKNGFLWVGDAIDNKGQWLNLY